MKNGWEIEMSKELTKPDKSVGRLIDHHSQLKNMVLNSFQKFFEKIQQWTMDAQRRSRRGYSDGVISQEQLQEMMLILSKEHIPMFMNPIVIFRINQILLAHRNKGVDLEQELIDWKTDLVREFEYYRPENVVKGEEADRYAHYES